MSFGYAFYISCLGLVLFQGLYGNSYVTSVTVKGAEQFSLQLVSSF